MSRLGSLRCILGLRHLLLKARGANVQAERSLQSKLINTISVDICTHTSYKRSITFYDCPCVYFSIVADAIVIT